MVLCFGFVTETMLIIHQWFSYYWRALAECQCLLLFLTLPYQQVAGGFTRSWEGTQLGQMTESDWRYIPYHMMSWSAIKDDKRRRKWGGVQNYGVCFPNYPLTHVEGLLSWKWLSNFLPMRNSEWILYFVLLVCTTSALAIKLSQLMIFLGFAPPHWGGK